MSPQKNLFEPDDFDKKKKLFTASDFDKDSKDNIPIEPSKPGKDRLSEYTSVKNPKSKIWILKSKIWIWILAGVFVVCIIICYFIFSKPVDDTATESEQTIEIAERSMVPSDSVSNQEEVSDEAIATNEEVVSNATDNQNAKESDVTTVNDNTTNISATTANTVTNISNDVEAEAMKVIRGDYGVGQERKDKLGARYQSIQSRVNELKREGIF